jgi:hypothetical protein
VIKKSVRNWILALVILVIAVAVVLVARRPSAPAARAAVSASYFACTPNQVGVFTNRVHVRCTTSVNISGNLIYYWAYPTSDSAGASRFLSLFETAKATGTTVTVFYDPNDLTGSTFSCGNSDCRRIWGATSP